MIERYFTICEILGYFSIFLMLMNALLLARYYALIFKAKKKVLSKTWLVVNTFLLISQVTLCILFVYNLIDPYAFSKQGKIDLVTAKNFVGFSISSVVIGIISIILTIVCQPLFGALIDKDKIFISSYYYVPKDFTLNTNKIKFGNKKKWKSIPKWTIVGKFILKNID